MEYRWHLQKYSGRSTRHECPNCRDPHSFIYYVDERGEVLDESVGRCNHESGCGYHYTPSQFFEDHPWKRETHSAQHSQAIQQTRNEPICKPSVELCFIDVEIVTRCFDRGLESDFAQWLLRYFPREKVGAVFQYYMVGKGKYNQSIFWQVDGLLRVRTGKIIQLDPETGHRLKNDDPRLIDRVEVNWVHTHLKRVGQMPESWTLSQCLFGEHLLKIDEFKDKPIAIVESEKTAVIASIVYPDWLWLATGGKTQFTEEKMRTLAGKTVYLFPDADAVEEWKSKIFPRLSKVAKTEWIDQAEARRLGRVENDWLKTLREDTNPNHRNWDIADYIIDEMDNPQTEEERQLKEMAQANPAVDLLLKSFDWEIVSNKQF